MGKPKEDPADKKARLRERRLSEIERMGASQNNAAGLSADVRAIYGMQPNSGPSQPFRPIKKAPPLSVFPQPPSRK